MLNEWRATWLTTIHGMVGFRLKVMNQCLSFYSIKKNIAYHLSPVEESHLNISVHSTLFPLSVIVPGVGIAQVIFSLFVLAHMTRYLAWLLLYLFHLFWAILAGRPGQYLLRLTTFFTELKF